MIMLIPAILSTKECHAYVGGSRVWEELISKHRDELPPFRTLPRGDTWYRRETVDKALMLAEARGSLIQDGSEKRPLILPRVGNRFQKPTTTGDEQS